MGCCPTLVPVILGASTHTFDNFLRLAWGGPRAQLLGVLSLGLSGQHERGVVLNPPQEAPPVPPGWVYQTRPARHSPSPSPCPACKHSSVPSLSPFLAKTPRSHLHNSALPTTAVFGVRIHPVIPVSLAAKLHIRLVACFSPFCAARGKAAAGSERNFLRTTRPPRLEWDSRNLGRQFRPFVAPLGGLHCLPCPLAVGLDAAWKGALSYKSHPQIPEASPPQPWILVFFQGTDSTSRLPSPCTRSRAKKKTQHSKTRPGRSRTHMVFVSRRTLYCED